MSRTATLDNPVTRTHGRYEITASRTVDGGYAINTMTATGGHREHALCLATANRDTARLAYRVIAEAGLGNLHPDDTAAALLAALTGELHRVQRRRDTRAAAEINRVLDLLVTADPARAAAEATMLAGIAANIAAAPVADRPRTLVDLRNAHAAAVTRDRAARLVVA